LGKKKLKFLEENGIGGGTHKGYMAKNYKRKERGRNRALLVYVKIQSALADQLSQYCLV